MKIAIKTNFAKMSLLSLAVMLGIIVPASAHSFDVLLIIDGPEEGNASYHAFRLATKERDGHANEESDGHLGGLDVYISTPDEFGGIEQALAASVPDFVVVPFGMDIADGFRAEVEASGAIFLSVANTTSKMQLDFLADFPSVFRQTFDHEPDAQALASYVAARLIDVAVRLQAGVDDRAAPDKILFQY